MKLTILGTGNALATKCYNTCFALAENGQTLLVDGGGGNGILRQLAQAGIDWRDVRDIFVTHKHIDHLMGVVWMVRMICQHMREGSYEGEARIYAHADLIEMIRTLSNMLIQKKDTAMLDSRLHLIAVADGETREILGCPVTFFDIGSTKAKQFGFSMVYADGRKLTCCGDEPFSECERRYAENSDWLMHEAFCLFDQADVFHPYEKHHSTVKDAAELAEGLHVRNLLLYHTEDRNLERRKELYSAEARRSTSANVLVPNDLETFEL